MRSDTAPFVKVSAGFEGNSDGWQDLNDNGVMDWAYTHADRGGGNVVLMAQLPTLNNETVTWDFTVGFGNSHNSATAEALGALADRAAA